MTKTSILPGRVFLMVVLAAVLLSACAGPITIDVGGGGSSGTSDGGAAASNQTFFLLLIVLLVAMFAMVIVAVSTR